MASNVCTWKAARAAGWQPGLYSYQEVPLGQYLAFLDFKVWAKQVMAISCYFTVAGAERKILLTVYCNGAGVYQVCGSTVNFATCPTGRMYRIEVRANQKKKIVLVRAELLPMT
jgi:hypothetical protein